MDKRSGLTKSWNSTCGALLSTNKTTELAFSHLSSSSTTALCMHLWELLLFSQTIVSTPASTFLFPLTLSIVLQRTGHVSWRMYIATLPWSSTSLENATRSKLTVFAPLSLQVGDFVWLLRHNIATTRPCPELDYKKLGLSESSRKLVPWLSA